MTKVGCAVRTDGHRMQCVTTAESRGGAPTVVLRLLGPVRLEVDGVDRTPLGPLLRGLLAALGCARGRVVPAETLAAVLAQLGAEPGDGDPLVGARVDAAQVQVHLARLADVLGP